MRTAVTGSIATDHLMTFAGLFGEQLLPEQLASLSVVFLADGLEIRRGGTGANISFGMGVLGERPLLIGSVGADAVDYLTWLSEHGVDTTGVRVSATLASPRFTVTTDQAQNQIGTFYPGAMAEAAGISLDGLSADLVLVSPNDPGAMLRHTAQCRERGLPFAADPSQTLTFLDGDAIRQLVEGATYLFSNEYEASLIADKTGWSSEQVLTLVGTRITTLGAKGCLVQRRGEPDLEVGIVPADHVADPTGTGDAFRAGFLSAISWGLGLERACQVGALLATLAVETVGPQDYEFTADTALPRLAAAFGDEAAAEIAPHLPR